MRRKALDYEKIVTARVVRPATASGRYQCRPPSARLGRRTFNKQNPARDPPTRPEMALLWGRRPLRELPNDEENPVNEKPTPRFHLRRLSKSSAPVFEIAGALAPDACDRARDAVNACFDAGKTTDRGVSLPTQDVLVSSLPQRSQDEIRAALEASASRASDELPPEIRLEFSMARAFCIVYDAGGQKGLKKHTDGRKEGATLLLLLSTPGVDFEGGGTRFFPSVLEPSFDAKPSKGSTVVFPSDTLQRGAARKSTREKYCVDLREPPRHRAHSVTGTTSRRWRGIATPSRRRSYGDSVASMAWGARNLISTQASAVRPSLMK